MNAVRVAIKMFKILVDKGEINRKDNFDLYSNYLDGDVQQILSCFEEEFEVKFLNFDDTIYLIPKLDSTILGLKPADLRRYFGSNPNQKDVYLGYYIIMYILYEFYSGENRDPKKIDYLQISYLIDRLDMRFDKFDKLDEEELNELEEEYSINIKSAIKIWTSMLVDHEIKRKTKYRMIINVCKILEEQKLAYVVEGEIRTTQKLDVLMRQYYLHADRVSGINQAFENGGL
ncbi:MAG: DUF6063 family protein [Tepidibacter sp.]|jgi:hypothetical protein|uniref:DUF6063 family protein n=1 Tax=Tepidibacter sp. TaxID=2529387 RepID=UPI0025F4021C|nr:DUF6063 family protein [Tepidibacter sp.]MCT4507753.1 DUF6063 family protein [Tepidibacter sp.]